MEYFLLEKRGRVGILTVNRPKALNALCTPLLEELNRFLSDGIHAEKLRALIVTGAGKAFIAGADIKEMLAMTHEENQAFCELGHATTRALAALDMVTIAAMNGFALGGGLELALACDFIYAAAGAKLGLPEVTLGLIPGFGGTQRLARAVGARRAKEMIMTGQAVDAEKALRIGLVNKVVAPGALIDDTVAAAEGILVNSCSAVMRAKRVVDEGFDLPLSEALEFEQRNFAEGFAAKDRTEGLSAFIEKRPPRFE